MTEALGRVANPRFDLSASFRGLRVFRGKTAVRHEATIVVAE
jgi:hypothetical protein